MATHSHSATKVHPDRLKLARPRRVYTCCRLPVRAVCGKARVCKITQSMATNSQQRSTAISVNSPPSPPTTSGVVCCLLRTLRRRFWVCLRFRVQHSRRCVRLAAARVEVELPDFPSHHPGGRVQIWGQQRLSPYRMPAPVRRAGSTAGDTKRVRGVPADRIPQLEGGLGADPWDLGSPALQLANAVAPTPQGH
jgi:hypothetical protein